MTLIEVVAGLALLGSLLVSVLLAKTRHTRQVAMAQHRMAAIAAADCLLAAWSADPISLPTTGSGDVDGATDLVWRTSVVPNDVAREFGASVVRLEIMDRPGQDPQPVVLVAVEVIIANKPERRVPPVGGKW